MALYSPCDALYEDMGNDTLLDILDQVLADRSPLVAEGNPDQEE